MKDIKLKNKKLFSSKLIGVVFFLNYAFVLSFLSATPALASWSTDGGFFIGNSANPWFLENVAEVKYCIVRGNGFSLDEEKSDAIIQSAIQFWKNEFVEPNLYASHIQGVQDSPPIRIATQNFIHTSCSDKTDIVFQLGIILNSEQHRILENQPKKIIGLAVRTEYDEVRLRGKGFIYISPDVNSVHLPPDNWSILNGSMFKWLIMHELGHVFGVPHLYPYGSWGKNIMEEDFPETLVKEGSESVSTFIFSVDNSRGQLIYRNSNVNSLPVFSSFFGLPTAENFTIWFTPKLNNEQQVKYADSFLNPMENPDSFQEIGKIVFSQTNPDVEMMPLIRVLVTKKQKVFSNVFSETDHLMFDRSLPGPGFLIQYYKATFISKDRSIIRPISFTIGRDNVKLGGILDEHLYLDLIRGF